MVKNNNNVIEEIQELIQQIKNEYQEGVDYKFVIRKESKKGGARWIDILSPRLKEYCRKKFNFPLIFNDYLDYHKNDKGGSWFIYRTHKHTTKDEGYDCIFVSKAKGGNTGGEAKGENCAVCGKLVFEENGWMGLWDGEKITGEPAPNIIGYFHPECAKKYFADKNQPDQNNKKITDDEQEWLKNLFQKYHIEKISFENGSLFIEYDKEVNSLEKAKVDSKSFQELKEYFQNHDEKEIDKRRLGINSNNTTNSNPNQGNYQLIIGLSLGAGAVILVGLIVFFVFRKRKNK